MGFLSLTAESPAKTRLFIVRLAAGVILVNLLVLCMVVVVLHQSRLQHEEKAKVTSENLSHVLERNIAGMIDRMDLVLTLVADEAERQYNSTGIDTRSLNTFLKRQHSRLPGVGYLRMADSRGDVIYGTSTTEGIKINIVDREYFMIHRTNPHAGLFISKPLLGRSSHNWLVVIARRVNGPDGSLLGVVYGTVALDYLSTIFASLDVGPHGGIALRDGEMGIITRYPVPENIASIIGNMPVSPELLKRFKAGQSAGTFFDSTSLDHIFRVLSYRKISRYPLYVSVDLATNDYLAEWREDVAKMSALTALYFLVTLLMARMIFIRWKREKLVENQLRESNEELELRIAKRTEELFNTNQSLEAELRERALVEQALEEKEVRLRTLVNTIPDLIWLKDSDGVYLSCNPMFERFFGVSEKDMVGKTDYEFVDRDLADSFREHDRKAIGESKPSINEEWLTFAANGHRGLFETIKTPMWDAEGELIGVLGIARDITERNQAEENIRLARDFYLTIFEGLPALIWRAGTDGLCNYFNTAWLAFTGRTIEQEMGNGWAEGIHPDDMERCLKIYLNALATQEPFDIEYRLLNCEGEFRWIIDYGRPYNDINGDFAGYIGTCYDITERRMAQQELLDHIQQRETIYQIVSRGKREWEQTFDAVPDLISIIDVNHTIIRVNKAMADRCGLGLEQFSGRKCYEVMHGMQSPPHYCPHVKNMLNEEVQAEELDEKKLNGIFNITVSPLSDAEGQVTAYVHVMRDITEQKQAEELVHQRLKLRDLAITSTMDELLQATLDACELLTNSSIGFFHLVDEEQKNVTLQAWSSNTLATMCTAKDKGHFYPISKAGLWTECFHSREPVIHNDFAALPNRKVLPAGHAPVIRQLTVPFVMNDRVVYIIGLGNKTTPYTQHDAYIVKQFVTFASEVIERKKAEVALAESEERHRKLANEQRVILNTSSVGICFLKDRKVLWANPAFDMIVGYEVGTTHSMDTAEFYYDKETYEHIGEKGYLVIDSGAIYSQDVMMKKKDGSVIWCNLVGQAVNPGDLDEGSIWIYMDITERRQAEHDRQKIEQQFQQTQKLESLGVLAGGIAHDFNNILTIILGYCYMINADIELETGPKTYNNQIEKAAKRAADLCRQMLSYAGQNMMIQGNINLWLLVDENVKMLRSAIKKNIDIKLDLKHDIPEIMGDSAQMQQVVMNLIINSAEAIGDKNGTINITLKKMTIPTDRTSTDFLGDAVPAGNYACLTVADNGCGMEIEIQKRVFEPFFTTKFTGRGLGMSAVLGIIKSHNGSLQLTSTPGAGTTFTVYLPLSNFRDVVEVSPTATFDRLEKRSEIILLVDDEETLLLIGSALLKAMGFSVITASNGREALEMYREKTGEIDLILLDLIMPEMDGIEAYHLLREISPVIPIAICSGYNLQQTMEKIANDEKAAVIQKPYDPDQLRTILVKLLEKPE